MYQSLEHMKQQGRPFALLYPYSIPLYHHLGWEIISNKISFNIKDRQIPTKVKAPGYVRRVDWDNTDFMSCIRICVDYARLSVPECTGVGGILALG